MRRSARAPQKFPCSLPASKYHCAVLGCGNFKPRQLPTFLPRRRTVFCYSRNTIKSWARLIDSSQERFLNINGTILGRPFSPQLVSCLEEATVALPIGRGALQGSTPSCYQWTNACAKGFVCEHASTAEKSSRRQRHPCPVPLPTFFHAHARACSRNHMFNHA